MHRRTLKQRDEDRALISAITFLSTKTITIVLRSQTLDFSFKSLALQDYNNKAPDDELATVPCLDIET